MDGSDYRNKRPVVKLATAGHHPLDTRIFHKEAKTLVQHGHAVTLVVPRPDEDPVEEVVEAVRIVSVPYPRHGGIKLLVTPLLILKKALQEPSESIIHIHDSELLGIGLVLRAIGRTVIYDAHEDTPLQIRYQHWIPRRIKPFYASFYYWLEKLVGKSFQQIIVAEPIIERYFPAHKTTLVRNFPMKAPFYQRAQRSEGMRRENQAVYIGSITQVRGIHEMLKAIALARQSVDITLLLAGRFHPEALKSSVEGQTGVNYIGWVGLKELVEINFRSKIGIIVPHPVERYRTNLPVKVFEYMAAGMPVILSETSEAAQYVRECEGGILVDPLDPAQIAQAIVELCQQEEKAQAMGQRGQQLIFEKYNWEQESQKLLAVYARL